MNTPYPFGRRSFLAMVIPIAWADGVRDDGNVVPLLIADYTFRPATLAIIAGQRVAWLNQDDVPHSIIHTPHPHLFRSNVLFPGDRFIAHFPRQGEYPFHCGINRHMRGTILVA